MKSNGPSGATRGGPVAIPGGGWMITALDANDTAASWPVVAWVDLLADGDDSVMLTALDADSDGLALESNWAKGTRTHVWHPDAIGDSVINSHETAVAYLRSQAAHT